MVFHHTSRLRGVACAASNAVSAAPTLLWMATSARRTLLNSARSMSTWMILGAGGEGGDLAGHAVIESGAERDEQVALLYRRHRGVHAVHPGHAEVLLVRIRERSSRHQRRDDRHAGALGEGQQLLRPHATSSVPPPT